MFIFAAKRLFLIYELLYLEMRRKRPRTTDRISCTKSDLHFATDNLMAKRLSLCSASIKYNIPYSIALSKNEWKMLREINLGCEMLPKLGIKVFVLAVSTSSKLILQCHTKLCKLAFQYVGTNNLKCLINKDAKIVGYDWFYSMRKRNSTMGIREPIQHQLIGKRKKMLHMLRENWRDTDHFCWNFYV